MNKIKCDIWIILKNIYRSVRKKVIKIFNSDFFESLCICLNKIWLEIIGLLFIWVMLNLAWIEGTHYLENWYNLLLAAILLICERVLNLFVWEDWYKRLIKSRKLSIVVVIWSIYLLFYYLWWRKNQD